MLVEGADRAIQLGIIQGCAVIVAVYQHELYRLDALEVVLWLVLFKGQPASIGLNK